MKIQFIIVGWHYHQQEFYEGLNELKNNNKEIDVFWSCHKEPPNYIKDNFNFKLFPNVGEEFIAYQQAVDYLNINDDTICFFIHDDVIIKSWEFINICIDKLNTYKFLGNCLNYPMSHFDPTDKNYVPDGISKEFDNKVAKDYAKDESKHLFDRKLAPVIVIRGSFICCKYKHLKELHGFEPRKEAWVGPEWSDEYQTYCYRGAKGLGKFGNMFMFMFSYKINRVFGPECISYLSNRYLDSDFIYEMGRGEIDPNNPML
jgi:hypothetical protein